METQNLPTKPNIDKKNILILFLVITNLFLVSYILLKKPTTPIKAPINSPQPTQSVTDPTSTWQTYTNNNLDFQFNYPNGFIYIPHSQETDNNYEDIIQSPDFQTTNTELGQETISGIRYSIFSNDGQCEFSDQNRVEFDPAIKSIQDITLGQIIGKKYHISWDGTIYESIQAQYNNFCIIINVYYGPNYENIWENQLDQILSTFKFIN